MWIELKNVFDTIICDSVNLFQCVSNLRDLRAVEGKDLADDTNGCDLKWLQSKSKVFFKFV